MTTRQTMTTQDNGTDFVITVTEDDAAVDISAATVSVEFKRPDGSTFTYPAALNGDGTDGKILLQSVGSLFEVNGVASKGIWQYRPIVLFSGQGTQFGGLDWAEFELVQ